MAMSLLPWRLANGGVLEAPLRPLGMAVGSRPRSCRRIRSRAAPEWGPSRDRPRRRSRATIGSAHRPHVHYCEPWPGNKKASLPAGPAGKWMLLLCSRRHFLGFVLFESCQSGARPSWPDRPASSSRYQAACRRGQEVRVRGRRSDVWLPWLGQRLGEKPRARPRRRPRHGPACFPTWRPVCPGRAWPRASHH